MSRNKILVIDDDEDIRQGLSIRLKANGYSVVTAVDAISAVSVARTENPDLIILDLGLPGGDGYAVMERLEKINCTAPVIVLSAKDPYQNIEKSLYAGAENYLQKPPDTNELLSAISKALEKST